MHIQKWSKTIHYDPGRIRGKTHITGNAFYISCPADCSSLPRVTVLGLTDCRVRKRSVVGKGLSHSTLLGSSRFMNVFVHICLKSHATRINISVETLCQFSILTVHQKCIPTPKCVSLSPVVRAATQFSLFRCWGPGLCVFHSPVF